MRDNVTVAENREALELVQKDLLQVLNVDIENESITDRILKVLPKITKVKRRFWWNTNFSEKEKRSLIGEAVNGSEVKDASHEVFHNAVINEFAKLKQDNNSPQAANSTLGSELQEKQELLFSICDFSLISDKIFSEFAPSFSQLAATSKQNPIFSDDGNDLEYVGEEVEVKGEPEPDGEKSKFTIEAESEAASDSRSDEEIIVALDGITLPPKESKAIGQQSTSNELHVTADGAALGFTGREKEIVVAADKPSKFYQAHCPAATENFRFLNLSQLEDQAGKSFKLDESAPAVGITLVLGSGSLKVVTVGHSVSTEKPDSYSKINNILKKFERSEIASDYAMKLLIQKYEAVKDAFAAETFSQDTANQATADLKQQYVTLFGDQQLTIEAGSILGKRAAGGDFTKQSECNAACEAAGVTFVPESKLSHVRLLTAVDLARNNQLNEGSTEALNEVISAIKNTTQTTFAVGGGGGEYTLKELYESDGSVKPQVPLSDVDRASNKNKKNNIAAWMFDETKIKEFLTRYDGMRLQGGLVWCGPQGSNRGFSTIQPGEDGEYKVTCFEFNSDLFKDVEKELTDNPQGSFDAVVEGAYKAKFSKSESVITEDELNILLQPQQAQEEKGNITIEELQELSQSQDVPPVNEDKKITQFMKDILQEEKFKAAVKALGVNDFDETNPDKESAVSNVLDSLKAKMTPTHVEKIQQSLGDATAIRKAESRNYVLTSLHEALKENQNEAFSNPDAQSSTNTEDSSKCAAAYHIYNRVVKESLDQSQENITPKLLSGAISDLNSRLQAAKPVSVQTGSSR
jgi:hypothetical protein